MRKLIAGLSGIVLVLFAVTVSAQTAQQVAQCRKANLKAHSEVVQLFNKARATGKITPAEAKTFAAMEKRLKLHQMALNRGGLTLAECQQIGREIAQERANVQRMAATPAVDPRVAQCRTANLKAHSEVVQLFNRARATGKITPAEAKRFAAIEARLKIHQAALNKGGLTLTECQQIGREIAQERADVQRMAARR